MEADETEAETDIGVVVRDIWRILLECDKCALKTKIKEHKKRQKHRERKQCKKERRKKKKARKPSKRGKGQRVDARLRFVAVLQ